MWHIILTMQSMQEEKVRHWSLVELVMLVVLGALLPSADVISDLLTALKFFRIMAELGVAVLAPVMLHSSLTVPKWWKAEGKS